MSVLFTFIFLLSCQLQEPSKNHGIIFLKNRSDKLVINSSNKNDVIKITKLAQGLPVGGEIESLDDGTLLSAFKNRSKINSNSS